jgi:hypothetical protein
MTRTGASLILAAALAVGLTACGSSTAADTPQLTQQQREDQFWTNYERRLGMVGRDYADPVEAKAASIRFGYFLCGELAKGTDRDVLISRGSGGVATREEFTTKLETAEEFLCPGQG